MCTIEQINITPILFYFSCVMEMRLGMASDLIDFKLFVKMKRIKRFENPKN